MFSRGLLSIFLWKSASLCMRKNRKRQSYLLSSNYMLELVGGHFRYRRLLFFFLNLFTFFIFPVLFFANDCIPVHEINLHILQYIVYEPLIRSKHLQAPWFQTSDICTAPNVKTAKHIPNCWLESKTGENMISFYAKCLLMPVNYHIWVIYIYDKRQMERLAILLVDLHIP